MTSRILIAFFLTLLVIETTSEGRWGGKGKGGWGGKGGGGGGWHKNKYFCKDQSPQQCPGGSKYLEFVIGATERCPEANTIYFPNFNWPSWGWGRHYGYGNKGKKICSTVSN